MVDLVGALAASGAAILLGRLILKSIPLFSRLNLPSPVVGGVLVSVGLAIFVLQGGAPVKFDLTFQTPLMVCFFATLGFGASISTIRKGGKQVLQFLAGATLVLIAQNLLGMVVAVVMGESPMLGVLTGSTAMAGGPGTVLAFAPQFAQRGVTDAKEVGLAAAMIGIIMGGTLGAPLGTCLIGKIADRKSIGTVTSSLTSKPQVIAVDSLKFVSALSDHIIIILLVMWAGMHLSSLIGECGVTVPVYIGAMIVAAFVRNLDDAYGLLTLDEEWIRAIGSIALALFLALSLLNLQLVELGKMAGPLLVLVVAQVVMVLLIARTICFKFFGSDYDAALMSAGFVGFMLGTTANAMANLEALRARFGPAPRAYLVVPLVGAGFLDFINALVIAFIINI